MLYGIRQLYALGDHSDFMLDGITAAVCFMGSDNFMLYGIRQLYASWDQTTLCFMGSQQLRVL